MSAMENRLSKVIAQAGVASRRACEQIIFEGRVKVNGKVVLEPQTRVRWGKDLIAVDGERLKQIEPKVYYLLNKPKGFVCTHHTGNKGKRVVDLLAETVPYRLFTVGRLDRDTEGLLVLTNDGEFAHKIIHPSANITKEYLVKTGQEIDHEHLTTISRGMAIDGVFVKPKKVSKVRRGTLKVVLQEGKKREVRRLLEQAGLNVLSLTRIRIGPLALNNLPIGAYREMTEQEKLLFTK